MWKPIYQPEPWPQYLKRRDNVGVPLMEVRKKYLEEQVLFENYVSQLQTLNTVNTLNSLASPGAEAAVGREITFDLKVTYYFDSVPGAVSRFYRSPTLINGYYRYRNTPNFSITCGFDMVWAKTARWQHESFPCGGKTIATLGPLTADGPLGDYGTGVTGSGLGYRIEDWGFEVD